MAQLSIFEKQKHFSNKDFTCSIGKLDIIYITFRNDSWLRFTSSDKINIRVEGRVLKFDDPATTKQRGGVFKLREATHRDSDILRHTRYVQINGKKWPGILEVVQRTAGSYDFPKKDEPTTSEELAEKYKPDLSMMTDKNLLEIKPSDMTTVKNFDRSDMTIAERFMADARELIAYATTSEERIAIYKTLGLIYGLKPDVLAQLVPKKSMTITSDLERPLDETVKDKWEI